jgi:hypothetical protein
LILFYFVLCLQGAKVEIEAIAVIGNIKDEQISNVGDDKCGCP